MATADAADLPAGSWAANAGVRRIMLGNVSRDTRPETAVRSLLHARGLRFRKHARPLPGLRCEADIIFSRPRVAVFIDGCYWHGCPEHWRRPATNGDYWVKKIGLNVARDRRNDRTLREAGWVVVRAWEHEPPEAVARRVALALARAAAVPPLDRVG